MDQTLAILELGILEEVAKETQLVPLGRIQERDVEQLVKLPVPLVMEEITRSIQLAGQKQICRSGQSDPEKAGSGTNGAADP